MYFGGSAICFLHMIFSYAIWEYYPAYIKLYFIKSICYFVLNYLSFTSFINIAYHSFQVMQFGRIDSNAYTLDFQYPFTALQAFAVALANVTQRLK